MIEILTLLVKMDTPFAFVLVALAAGVAIPLSIWIVQRAALRRDKIAREYDLAKERNKLVTIPQREDSDA